MSLTSCNTSNNARKTKEPMPEWVENRPTSGMYYTGIGSANKEGLSPNSYMQNASNIALNALASEISVNISSNSVMSTIETDYQLSETYQRTIKSSSDKNIEGYETVDTWDGGDYYWVYYRLSKMQYEQQNKIKKDAAITQAKTKYLQAGELVNQGNQYEAIHSYVDALSNLSEYLSESTETTIDGSSLDLGSVIYRDLIQSITDVKINSAQNPINLTNGLNIDPNVLQCKLSVEKGTPLHSMPVVLSFTGSGLRDNKIVSDQLGILQIPLNKIVTTNQMETLTVELDMVTLSRLTKNIFIRTIIKKIPPPTYKLQINVKSPLIFIQTTEKSFGIQNSNTQLSDAIFQAMAKNNMRLTDNSSDADFLIKLESNTEEAVTNSYQKTVRLGYSITVFDKDNRIVFRKDEKDIDGYGDNLQEANVEAYKSASNRIVRKSFNDILQGIY
jgi:hypothetical protein